MREYRMKERTRKQTWLVYRHRLKKKNHRAYFVLFKPFVHTHTHTQAVTSFLSFAYARRSSGYDKKKMKQKKTEIKSEWKKFEKRVLKWTSSIQIKINGYICWRKTFILFWDKNCTIFVLFVWILQVENKTRHFL